MIYRPCSALIPPSLTMAKAIVAISPRQAGKLIIPPSSWVLTCPLIGRSLITVADIRSVLTNKLLTSTLSWNASSRLFLIFTHWVYRMSLDRTASLPVLSSSSLMVLVIFAVDSTFPPMTSLLLAYDRRWRWWVDRSIPLIPDVSSTVTVGTCACTYAWIFRVVINLNAFFRLTLAVPQWKFATRWAWETRHVVQ